MKEIWKPIKDYKEYFISNLGRVKSIKRGRERILKIDQFNNSISRVTLYKDDKPHGQLLHSIVAQEFLNYVPNLRNDIVISHIDGDTLNCCSDNLKLITARENMDKVRKHKYGDILPVGSKEYYRMIYILQREGITQKEYFSNPEKYNISRRRKKHLDYDLYSSEYYKNIWLIKQYGIDFKQYEELLTLQNYKCAICGNTGKSFSTKSDKSDLLYVDHDHITGKVRGLLCFACNTGLGSFKDSLQSLQNAIKYLSSTIDFQIEMPDDRN